MQIFKLIFCVTIPILNCSNTNLHSRVNKSSPSRNIKYKEIIQILYPDFETREDYFKIEYEVGTMKTIDLSGKKLEVFPKSLFQLPNLTKIDISNNSIYEIPEDIPIPRNVAYIDMSNNCLDKFPIIFSKIPSLKHLDISENCISEFPDWPKRCILEEVVPKQAKPILNFNNLEYLNLSGNSITKIPDYFFELKNLKTLLLNNNKIQEISFETDFNNSLLETLEVNRNSLIGFKINLPCLKKIDLSGNFIEAFPNSLIVSKSIETVNLSNNALKDLPSTNFLSKLIKSVDLSSNMIDSVGSFIKTLGENIEYMNLQDNFLKSIPDEINTLKQLKFLDLGYNCISKIPEWFHELVKLEYLNLSDNIFSESQKLKVDKAFELKSLKTLKLRYTEFEMADLYENENILELDVGNCRLFQIPNFIFKLTNLKKLNLSGNEINYLNPNIGCLINLEELDISENSLRGIPHLINLKKLKTLNLAFNRLVFEIYDFSDFGELTTLDISNKYKENKVLKYIKIPDSLETLVLKGHSRLDSEFSIDQTNENLKTVYLSGCDLDRIPEFLYEFKKITNLDLSYNLLENPWEQTKKFENLRRLNLRHNLVNTFECLDHLFENLEYLDISKNHISTLPYNFKDFKYLKTLIAVDCNIKNLDFDFNDLTDLRDLVTNIPFRFYNPISKKSILDCKKLKNLILPNIKFFNQLPDEYRKYREIMRLMLNHKYEKFVFRKISETSEFFEIDIKSMPEQYKKLSKSSYINELIKNELVLCMSFDSIDEFDLNKNYSQISNDIIHGHHCNRFI